MSRHASLWTYALRAMRAVVIAVACLAVVVPLAYLLINSVKLPREFLSVPPTLLPKHVTFQHYRQILDDPKTYRNITNTVYVASITTLVTVVFGTLAAYGLSRMRLPPKVLGVITFVFLFIRFYPRVTTIIPYFLIMREFDLVDTIWAVIIGHLGLTIPFITWLLIVVFNDLPPEIEEAAVVDGANPWQRFWKVVLPMTKPSIASAAILTAFLSWNEFFVAASVTRRDARVLSIAVAGFVSDKGIQWGPMAAMSTIMIIPMILFALSVQRYLLRGITLGAVKG